MNTKLRTRRAEYSKYLNGYGMNLDGTFLSTPF